MPSDLLTPLQVAQAIQVSESSIKRWCDKGIIPTEYTAGGHRRIPVAGLLQFLRSQKMSLSHPEALGLPPIREDSPQVPEEIVPPFTECLLRGDFGTSRQLILELYLREFDIAAIGDRVMSSAMAEIGLQWAAGMAEVYQERRACQICLRILHELARLMTDPPETAPLAIGGTPEGDTYLLATTLVELALRDAGWRAFSLGSGLPLGSFAAAIRDRRPQLAWLSISHLEDTPRFRREFAELYDEFGHEILFVLGGRECDADLRKSLRFSAYCENLGELSRLCGTLRCQAENNAR
jgi:MerR family transcriptional regulator, light-induced transcriptional regulator